MLLALFVGAAEAMLDLYRDRLDRRRAAYSPVLTGDTVAGQTRYARAVSALRAAQALLRATLDLTVDVNAQSTEEHHVLRVEDMRDGTAPGGRLHQASFFRAPWITYAPLTFTAPMLGAARGALEEYRAWTAERASLFGARVAEFTSIQTRLARAAADLDAAELLTYRAVDVAEAPEPASPELRTRTYRDTARASELIVAAMDTVMQISGAAGFAASSPIQRAWRDVHFAASHVILNPETSFAAWGRQQFGLERDPKQLLY